MNSNDDPRALRQAQNAERQRMQRANRVSLEEENNHRRARHVIPGVREHESAQQAVAREDGVTRQNENNDDPPQQNHERTPLCYEFAKVLHSLVKRQFSEAEVVDSSNLIKRFKDLHVDFVDVESEYDIVSLYL